MTRANKKKILGANFKAVELQVIHKAFVETSVSLWNTMPLSVSSKVKVNNDIT